MTVCNLYAARNIKHKIDDLYFAWQLYHDGICVSVIY